MISLDSLSDHIIIQWSEKKPANKQPQLVPIRFSAHEQPWAEPSNADVAAEEFKNRADLISIELIGKNTVKLTCPNAKEYLFRSQYDLMLSRESEGSPALSPSEDNELRIIFDTNYFHYCINPLLLPRRQSSAQRKSDRSPVINVKGLENKIDCLQSIKSNGPNYANILIKHLLHEISVELFREITRDVPLILPKPSSLNIIPPEHFSYYLESNFKKAWTVAELAEVMGKSLSSFKRFFLIIYKKSPVQWLISRRLAYAYYLWFNYDYSAETICLLCGFGEVSHFITSFKKRFGFSPRQSSVQSPTANTPADH